MKAEIKKNIKIEVSENILSGNLFTESGYDEMASACKFIEIYEGEIEAMLSEMYPGADIEIDITAQDSSGYSSEADIYIEINGEADYSDVEYVGLMVKQAGESIIVDGGWEIVQWKN